MSRFLPDFKTTFLIVGISYILLSLGLFAQGLIPSMADFQVPAAVLQSSHYVDALTWAYVHMTVLGCLITLIGYAVTDKEKQKWISLILFLITCFYTYLDVRSADFFLGNALYKGDASLIPVFIGLIVNFLFLQLTSRLFIQKGKSYVEMK